jgi:hypothetical protein
MGYLRHVNSLFSRIFSLPENKIISLAKAAMQFFDGPKALIKAIALNLHIKCRIFLS